MWYVDSMIRLMLCQGLIIHDCVFVPAVLHCTVGVAFSEAIEWRLLVFAVDCRLVAFTAFIIVMHLLNVSFSHVHRWFVADFSCILKLLFLLEFTAYNIASISLIPDNVSINPALLIVYLPSSHRFWFVLRYEFMPVRSTIFLRIHARFTTTQIKQVLISLLYCFRWARCS